MALRRSIVAGNWKMHKTIPESLALAGDLARDLREVVGLCDVVLCPPFTAETAVNG
ncbi:MAG: triose-phosphate isomerase, partial [Firmicutes bacterium]|nr:triose-phosphate isomerase [Bacillota bacterium]